MAEVSIPGDELERVAVTLGNVLNLIDQKTPAFMTENEVGRPLVRAGENFDSRWSDGRTQLRRESEGLKAAAEEILAAFQQVDEDLGNSLKGEGPQ